MCVYEYKDKVSIIVPIYNVERYIERCVKSLTSQDYPNIEIILVDDGSPDGSAAVVDAMAGQDERIVVIHKENEGVSSARNAGLAIATGTYVMFVDGDDWVEPDYVSYFLSLVKENSCLIAMNKYNFGVEDSVSSDKSYSVSAEKAIEWIYMGKVFVAVWNKIYSVKLLKEYALCFSNEIWYGEGMLFNIECLQYCDKVAIGEKSVYHQTFNPNSAMRSFSLKNNYCGIHSLDIQKEKWKKVNKKIENAWLYHRYCFNRSILDGLVRTDIITENKDLCDECKRNIKRNIKIPLMADIGLKTKLSWIAYAIAPDLMAKRSARKFGMAVKSGREI